jgi:hypothetical protein
MQHCVITDVPLGQMRWEPEGFLVWLLSTHSFLPIRRVRTPSAREGRFSAILRSRTSQSPLEKETREDDGCFSEGMPMGQNRTENLVRLSEAKRSAIHGH